MTVIGKLVLVAGLFWHADAAQEPVMGNWSGEWSAASGAQGKVSAKIFGTGRDDYDSLFSVDRDGETKEIRILLRGKIQDGKWTSEGTLELGPEDGGTYQWTASVTGGEFTMHGESPEESFDLTMKRVELKSPTLGAKPPEGAVVLFDGTNLDSWTTRSGEPAHWKLIDGAMQVGARPDAKVLRGDIKSKPKFTDATIHVEFRTPYMPLMRGQLRGNSGVYIQGRYELQVLDSFGLPPKDNEAGGIYTMAVPKINASLPPGEWQTYDIDFTAPRFNDKGEKVKPAQITVRHNGELIHDNVTLRDITPGGDGSDPREPGVLLLQDHGNPVQFRNIWFVPKKSD
ncbi:MAG: DUF1080 domain-containing protein [Planctomycetota bacterium]